MIFSYCTKDIKFPGERALALAFSLYSTLPTVGANLSIREWSSRRPKAMEISFGFSSKERNHSILSVLGPGNGIPYPFLFLPKNKIREWESRELSYSTI